MKKIYNEAIWSLVITIMFIAGSVAHADQEPENNADPTNGGMQTAVLINAKYSSFSIDWAQITQNDIDHWLVHCPENGGPQRVKSATMNFSHATGDLDLLALDLVGNWLDISQSVSNSEHVEIPVGHNLVVIKVYGYRNATGEYSIKFDCAPAL